MGKSVTHESCELLGRPETSCVRGLGCDCGDNGFSCSRTAWEHTSHHIPIESIQLFSLNGDRNDGIMMLLMCGFHRGMRVRNMGLPEDMFTHDILMPNVPLRH